MYIKLKAQRLLIGKNSKAFLICTLPFLMTVSLLGFNYYLLIYLNNNTELNFALKFSLMMLSLTISAFIKSSVVFICENYFYRKATDSFSPVRAQDLFCAFLVRILKMLLFWFLSAVFFLPGLVLAYSAYYVKSISYPKEITVTLFASSLIMVLVGAGCFFVIYKRFSKSYFVQFQSGETNPLKVLSKSSEMMEGNLIRYSLFCLSFLGWDVLCLTLFPIIYVLPYRKSAKYVFFREKVRRKLPNVISEKPIVFIFSKS